MKIEQKGSSEEDRSFKPGAGMTWPASGFNGPSEAESMCPPDCPTLPPARFEIMKLLKEKEISQEAFDSYSVQLDEVLLRERKIQASILLEHPTIIATLKGERTDTRRQCDLAVSYLISGNDSSVSSR